MDILTVWLMLAGLSLVVLIEFSRRLERSLAQAPRLPRRDPADLGSPVRITVIVPAYNEALNLGDCARAILASHLPAGSYLRLCLADDQSGDRTLEIAQDLARKFPQVVALAVPPRPSDQAWRGKNWACAWTSDWLVEGFVQSPIESQEESEFWLFLDADVRLEPGAIAAAVAHARATGADLLSCAPDLVCGCLSEWLVQPLVISAISIGFDFASVNDPASPTAFAAGPFMLFRRAAYLDIGGHRAVAENFVEDLALGTKIKASGRRLVYVLANGQVNVRMYQNFAALWEGWTKNWFAGGGYRLGATLYGAAVLWLAFAGPWLAAIAGGVALGGGDLRGAWLLGLAAGAIALHYRLRWICWQQCGLPTRYWWLAGLGGWLTTAIALASIVKTLTGWGWTWRGRSLA